MNRRPRRHLIIALTLVTSQVFAIAGMLGTAALIESGQHAVEQRTDMVAASPAPVDGELERRDPLRLILF